MRGTAPRRLQAVRDVSFTLQPGETLGIVGESGCGKSTLGRCIVGLYEPTAGTVLYRGAVLHGAGTDRRTTGRRVQMIFQDPYASLNPRLSIGRALAEVLTVHGLAKSAGERRDRVAALLSMVGLSPQLADRLPHAFSGGQRQRVSIARALAAEPEIIVADEPVSALDVSIQAQIVNLFIELRERLGLAYVFIAHDLSVVRHISHRVGVMYLGQIVELAEAGALFREPGHPYTRALLSAIPLPDPDRRTRVASLEGELPDPHDPPPGCSFNTRCPLAVDLCRRAMPELSEHRPGRFVRCHRAFEAG
ncbi:MAG: ATP-binding cassette domain-containing protein [Rhodospirillaceae bacterium]|nr:ATP-binding cassette domain-containing protein [Rhodospirillaceae bacterium]